MEVIVILALVAVLLVIWGVSTRRKLAFLNENINNAMGQIGVQLSSRFDALTALLDLIKDYTAPESQALVEIIRSRHSAITAASSPAEVLQQEDVIRDILSCISLEAKRYPALKADRGFTRCMDAMDSYENMLRTSYLIYNDSVAKLNHAVRTLPTSLIAGLLGFRQREFINETTK